MRAAADIRVVDCAALSVVSGIIQHTLDLRCRQACLMLPKNKI
ncbi:hypothetical protein GFS60_08154 (plasmid) [Rhodococcus sp. WAY2]|nr:hypothetical protein GFS60_08154 [Rhodococcus sp. WAY2]